MCRSYLAIPSNSWVDDFIDWLNPGSKCCRLYTFGPNMGKFCPASEREKKNTHIITFNLNFHLYDVDMMLTLSSPRQQLLSSVCASVWPLPRMVSSGPIQNNSTASSLTSWVTGLTCSAPKGVYHSHTHTKTTLHENNILTAYPLLQQRFRSLRHGRSERWIWRNYRYVSHFRALRDVSDIHFNGEGDIN